MTRRVPPNPGQFRSLEQWARQFYEYFIAETRIKEDNDPLPVQLPHRVGNIMERATTDGVILYDPILDRPVFSINGAWLPILLEEDVAVSQFGELQVVERTPIIELNSRYGVSAIRDVTETNGSATVSDGTSEIVLSTGTTANSAAILETAERGRYVPGFAAEIGIGMRFPTAPTGNQTSRWGGQDDNIDSGVANGFYYGYDATGVFVAYSDGGTETKVYQDSWNVDTLDGSGGASNPTGLTLDMSAGNIFQIEFTWYGYGEISFQIVASDAQGRQKPRRVHFLRIEGSTSIEDPNLYLFSRADNGADTTDFTAYVGGRSFTIMGRYMPEKRVTGQERSGVSTSTTVVPIVSFRRKTGFLDRAVRAQGFEVDVATEDGIVEIRLNGSLTGASWTTPTNYTAAETACETDVSASAISGGEVLFTQFVKAGSGVNSIFSAAVASLASVEVPRQQPISLCFRTITGTGTILGNFKVAEEW